MTINELYRIHMDLATWFRVQARSTDSLENVEEMNGHALSLEMAATRIAHCSMVVDGSDLARLASSTFALPRRTRNSENWLGDECRLGFDLIKQCLNDDGYLSRLMYRRSIHELTEQPGSGRRLRGKAQ
ncbi:MAG: hypothetical protein AMXMBFR59_12680 [Rhodanobacteraceae bacterium]